LSQLFPGTRMTVRFCVWIGDFLDWTKAIIHSLIMIFGADQVNLVEFGPNSYNIQNPMKSLIINVWMWWTLFPLYPDLRITVNTYGEGKTLLRHQNLQLSRVMISKTSNSLRNQSQHSFSKTLFRCRACDPKFGESS
jgi:hypothetical protein